MCLGTTPCPVGLGGGQKSWRRWQLLRAAARLIECLAQRIIKIVQSLGARVHHRAGNDPDRDEIVLARDARGVLVLGLVGHHPADQGVVVAQLLKNAG